MATKLAKLPRPETPTRRPYMGEQEWPIPLSPAETVLRPFTAPAFPGSEGQRSPHPVFTSGYGRSLAPAYELGRSSVWRELPPPDWPPLRLYVTCAGRGTMPFPDLDPSMQIKQLKELVYERLLLSPHHSMQLTSWGRQLSDQYTLADYRLPPNAKLELQLAPARPDDGRGLRRVRVASTCLRTRQIEVHERTAVWQLKDLIAAHIANGEHVWYDCDGMPHQRVGATALVRASSKGDAKAGTSSVRFCEEVLVEDVGRLGNAKGVLNAYRAASGRAIVVQDQNVVRVDLPREKQALSFRGRPLRDEERLFGAGLRHDDTVRYGEIWGDITGAAARRHGDVTAPCRRAAGDARVCLARARQAARRPPRAAGGEEEGQGEEGRAEEEEEEVTPRESPDFPMR